MSKPKKGLLPSLEIIIILVFFLSFIMWAVSKCGTTKLETQGDLEEEGETLTDAETDSIYFSMPKPLPPKEEPIEVPITTTTSTSGNTTVQTKILSRLYVTIDGLNMRTGPHLDSSVVEKFPLFEEVYFTGQYTDSTQQISLGKVMADEPWIQVQSKRGKVGWVYGAGVDYRRKKREGVQ